MQFFGSKAPEPAKPGTRFPPKLSGSSVSQCHSHRAHSPQRHSAISRYEDETLGDKIKAFNPELRAWISDAQSGAPEAAWKNENTQKFIAFAGGLNPCACAFALPASC